MALVEHGNGFSLEVAFAFVNASVEEHLEYFGEVVGSAEKACVAGDTAHGIGVGVVNHAANKAVAIGLVYLGGRDT